MIVGTHLILDVLTFNESDEDKIKLKNIEFGKDVLTKIVSEVRMSIIGSFHDHQFVDDKTKDDLGYTINGMLMESHITIHTWPESGYFSFDLFSCNNFSDKKVIDIIKEHFNIKESHGVFIKRSFKSQNIVKNIKYIAGNKT